jgi:hypothetical protein
MKGYFDDIGDAVRYALGDKYAILIIGVIVVVASFVNKSAIFPSPIMRVLNVFLLIEVGYGSYISWYTLKGSDELPKIANIKKLAWEGFRKSCIIFVYGIFLSAFISASQQAYADGNYLLTAVFVVCFVIVYLTMVGGLINRYLYRGKISKAFYVPEIYMLLRSFDGKTFVKFIAAVIIAQVFTLSVFLDFHKEFIIVDILISISTFFLAPFLFMATKRLVGLQVRKILEKSWE